MNIGVFGLGYVGVVNLACFARLGHHVIGCDIKSQKVAAVLAGHSPVFEPGVEELLQQGLAEGRLSASTDARHVVLSSDILLICVGTPSMSDGTVNLDYTINTTEEIATILAETHHTVTIAYRSTIPPGTVEGVFRPIFDQKLSGYQGTLKLAFYPEFLREGSAIKDFMQAPRIVIGTREADISPLETLLHYNETSPVVVTDTETAEFVKYVDNSFHAVKIAFVNEVYAIGAALGADVAKANEIFLMDTQLNIARTYLRPGMPFGGSCLPKDLRAMQYFSAKTGIEAPLLNHVLPSNQAFQQRILQRVLATGRPKVALLGLTFKNHTDDVRESPMLQLAYDMIAAGLEVGIYDEDINLTTLRIEQVRIVKHIRTDLEGLIGTSALILACKRYMSPAAALAQAGQLIFNLADQQAYETAADVEMLYTVIS